ncbi:aminotransferase class V-fold PLP-dependent enzyme [Spirillospora sp. CA-294931]|uniref:aminotransferase class V-fold PLP-dependent enzyme n=1 Tax=Spirillospora sp. CA-294931 TaxID=3240042 RepID=UPI003D92D3ED
MPSRRTILGGAVAGAGLAASGLGGESRFDPGDWGSVRAQFPLTRRRMHFTAYYLASHPAPVARAIERHRRELDRDTAVYVEGFDAFDLAARKAAAGYLGGGPDEIALTDSTTMGLGLLYAGLRLRPGEEVLTTEHDFYATHESLRLRAERDGAVVRRVRLYEDPATATVDSMVSRLRAAVTAKTRVVAVTWVHSGTGVRLPVREIADMLAGRALLCVDAVHGFGAEDATPGALGCDFFVTGTHKWLFGPRGTGVVWGRPEAWALVAPTVPSFCLPALLGWWSGRPPEGPAAVLATPGGFHSFENRWALPEAFAFHRAIGPGRVAARTRSQAGRLKEGLAGLRHVRLHTPRDPAVSSGLVCCTVEGHKPDAVVKRLLGEHGIVASVTPYREQSVRFGPSIVTAPAEVDAVVRAMAALR